MGFFFFFFFWKEVQFFLSSFLESIMLPRNCEATTILWALLKREPTDLRACTAAANVQWCWSRTLRPEELQ